MTNHPDTDPTTTGTPRKYRPFELLLGNGYGKRQNNGECQTRGARNTLKAVEKVEDHGPCGIVFEPSFGDPAPEQFDFADLLFPDLDLAADMDVASKKLTRLRVARASREAGWNPEADPAPGMPDEQADRQAFAPVWRVRLVREDTIALRQSARIHSPRDGVPLLKRYLCGADREVFVVVLLDTKNGVLGIHTVSVGDLSSAIVHPREVFKVAILSSAASILVAHNHPSGDPTPSAEDISVTRRLAEAGKLMGIELLDHLVLGEGERYVSLKEQGHF